MPGESLRQLPWQQPGNAAPLEEEQDTDLYPKEITCRCSSPCCHQQQKVLEACRPLCWWEDIPLQRKQQLCGPGEAAVASFPWDRTRTDWKFQTLNSCLTTMSWSLPWDEYGLVFSTTLVEALNCAHVCICTRADTHMHTHTHTQGQCLWSPSLIERDDKQAWTTYEGKHRATFANYPEPDCNITALHIAHLNVEVCMLHSP